MAIDVLSQEGFGDFLGKNFGTGLSSGLNQLANIKLNQYAANQQRQQIQQGLSSLFTPEQAQTLSSLPSELLQPIIKQQLQAPSNAAYLQGIQSFLDGEQMAPQQGVQQQSPGGLAIQPGLNAQQATKLAELGLRKKEIEENRALKQEAANLKKQEAIQKRNEPFLKEIRESKPIAQKTFDLATQMKQLLDTGKVRSGLGGYIPNAIQNPETQQFIAKSNELAGLIASSGKGVPTNFKIKLAQISKPEVTQSEATKRALLDGLVKDAQKILLKDEARQQIIDEHNGKEPENIESLVKRRVHKLKKEQEASLDLPDVSEYSEDAVIRVDGKTYERSGNEWKLVKG